MYTRCTHSNLHPHVHTGVLTQTYTHMYTQVYSLKLTSTCTHRHTHSNFTHMHTHVQMEVLKEGYIMQQGSFQVQYIYILSSFTLPLCMRAYFVSKVYFLWTLNTVYRVVACTPVCQSCVLCTSKVLLSGLFRLYIAHVLMLFCLTVCT